MSQANDAVDCFNHGFNCAQAVFSTYCEQLGLEKKTALKISCGFGAGMGRLGETCGAVAGAYLLIGLMHGKCDSDDNQSKEKTYELVQEFSKRFIERNQSTICRELIKVDFQSGDPQTIAAQVKTVCPKMVRDASEIIENMLLR
jgi:C_GCAxxG_C_C family probable redox protein